jgi:hypothetical protein
MKKDGSTTAFKLEPIGGLLLVSLRGLATLSTIRQTREAIRTAVAKRMAVKVLIDCRRAVLLLGRSQFDIITAESSAVPVQVPIGYLVDQAHHQAVFEHCQASALAGHTRVVFISIEKAQAWTGLPDGALAPVREFVPLGRHP